MANFNTHLAVALAASSGLALATTQFHITQIIDAPAMIAFGAIGGMLPDIDSPNSKPVKLLFTTLGIISLLTVVNIFQQRFAAYLVLIVAAITYGFVRYAVAALFDKFTIHRGIFHSVLTAVFFCLLMVCIACYLLRWDVTYAWLSGLFIGFGFIVHLVLDEVYSVDLSNRRLKKSFGTALKLYSYDNLMTSGMMAAATVALIIITPQPQPVFKLWLNQYQRAVHTSVSHQTNLKLSSFFNSYLSS